VDVQEDTIFCPFTHIRKKKIEHKLALLTLLNREQFVMIITMKHKNYEQWKLLFIHFNILHY